MSKPSAPPEDPGAPRRRIAEAQAALETRFEAGEDVVELVRARARAVDTVLVDLYRNHPWPELPPGALAPALLAVGGYGRGELHPHSDIDILVLLDGPTAEDAELREAVAAFVARLWDLGPTIGHAVRTVDDCAIEARRDLTVVTNLMEARTLAGSEALRFAMDEAIALDKCWPAPEFFRAKVEEQDRRYRRYDNTEYNLEPNVKSGPGGLRDLQLVRWIAKRHFGTSRLENLIGHGLLTARELLELNAAEQFLWKVRWGLHVLTGRGEDRLLFDHQRELARRFGYTESDGQLAVERFMHDYYVHVFEVRELSELIRQHFEEVILGEGSSGPVEFVDDRFRIRDAHVEVTSPDVFRRDPSTLLEIFVLMANRPDVEGVRAGTIRAIAEHVWLIDDTFRADRRNAALFMELLRSPHRLVSQLTRMRRYGVLGAYLPEFGRIVGQMQHDLFHIYTVDAHTMLLLRNLRRFRFESSRETFPLAYHTVNAVPKPELLYIAGIYHDIAKGRGGDHSELGAQDVTRFAERHGLPEADTELVRWLVADHLLMSSTAQRRDISDPEVIREFAREVRTEERLDYLYALTAADINATNPKLWNSWRAQLLWTLYNETRRFLRRGVEQEVDRETWIDETRAAAVVKLEREGMKREVLDKLFAEADDDYFLKYDHNDIAWQVRTLDHWDAHRDGPLVRIRRSFREEERAPIGATEIFVYCVDRPHLFAATVAVLDALDLSVLDARIHTGSGQVCFNTFMVLDRDGHPLQDEAQFERIETELAAALSDPDRQPEIVRRRVPRELRQFTIPTQVQLTNDGSAPYTELRVVAADRPGLLARIGLIFVEQDIQLTGAKIATLGERIDDVFFITDAQGEPITEAQRIEALRCAIAERIDAETGAAAEANAS
ncbi:MAG: [protein-PII] uridylyltransferase [Pseudomonadales bacterium]|jgi:[protein-PII] uridylyltransferase|nr:[protein-PII] uridylyltransferase [Pseudomonadales bacterium]